MLEIVFIILFFLTGFAVMQTYVIYPVWMKLLAFFYASKNNFEISSEQPKVSIIMAAHNEESVIAQKLESILQSEYPLEQLTVYVGSDNSSDKTNEIVLDYQRNYPQIQLIPFTKRQGKINIMNHLANLSDAEWIIFTDANVFFTPMTISHLLQYHAQEEIGMVCGHILKQEKGKKGASEAEVFYMNSENDLKMNESKVFGFCLGAEGGCFAIRKHFFEPVPATFAVDDFFSTLSVIRQKGKIFYEKDAVCYEDTTGNTLLEFKRKARIQKGNLQNIFHFWKMLFLPFTTVGFAMWSHKILRWFTPFFLILNAICSIILSFYIAYFWIMTLPVVLFFIFPIVHKWLGKMGLKHAFMDAFYHFVMMNYGLMKGTFDFLFGPKTSIWERTQRNA